MVDLKAPWKKESGGFLIFDSDGTPFADVTVDVTQKTSEGWDRAAAQTHLMVAAPELLAALRAACEQFLSANGSSPPREWLMAVARAEDRA